MTDNTYVFGELCHCATGCRCEESCQCSTTECDCAEECGCEQLCSCDQGDQIGEGTYSEVYQITKEGKDVAVKTMAPDLATTYLTTGLSHAVLIDYDVMARLRHPHIAQLITLVPHTIDNVTTLAAVMPLAKTDVHQAVYNMPNHPLHKLPHALDTIYKWVAAYSFLHEQGILHLDPKLSNFLLMEDGTSILTDFSVSGYTVDAKAPMSLDQIGYSVLCRAPELLELKPDDIPSYNAANEVWALGICTLMLMMKVARRTSKIWSIDYNNASVVQAFIAEYLKPGVIEATIVGWLSKPAGLSGNKAPLTPEMLGVVKLLTRMLDWNPATRITMAGIAADPIFGSERKIPSGSLVAIDRPTSTDVKNMHVNQVIDTFKVVFPLATVEALFLAVDLLYRTNSTSTEAVIACAWLGYKLVLVSSTEEATAEAKLLQTLLDGSMERLLAEEQRLVLTLGGRLYPPHLYAMCRTAAHVRAALAVLTNPTAYLALVGPKLTEWVSNQPIEMQPTPKIMVLSTLL